MKSIRAFAGATSILLPLGAAHAQAPAIQQLQNTQLQQLQQSMPELHAGTNAPELYTGENTDIGPQHILRVGAAGQAPRRNWLDASFDTQVFYTDNANFSSADSRISSWVFVNTAQAAISPDPFNVGRGQFAPSIGFSSQWFNYNDPRMRPLDFDAQTAFVNLRYLLGNWQFTVGGNFTRLVDQGSYAETYQEWLPNLGVQRIVPLNSTMAFIVGDAVSYHFTKITPYAYRPDVNDHFDNTAYLTFNWQASSHLVVQPFYRFQYSDYQFDTTATTTRTDFLSAMGMSLVYNFNQYASLRTFFSYTSKISSDSNTPTYDEINGGIGATLDIRF